MSLQVQTELLLMTDPAGQVLFANPPARQQWPASTQSPGQQSVWQLLASDRYDPALLNQMVTHLSTGEQLRLQLTTAQGDGNEIIFDTKISSLISNQKQSRLFTCRPLPEEQTELEQTQHDSFSNPDLAAIFNNLNDAFLRIDQRGAILIATPNLSMMLGLNHEQPIRRYSLRRFINDQQWHKLLTVLNGGTGSCEELNLEFQTITGESKIFAFTGSTWHHDTRQPAGLEGTLRDVTERLQRQQQLIDSETRYRTLFTQANDAVFLMRNEVIVDLNQRALEMFQSERETLIGTGIEALSQITNTENEEAYQQKKQHIKTQIYETLNSVATGETRKFEWRSQRSDGSDLDLEISLSGITLAKGIYFIVIMRDITQRMADHAALLASEKRYDTIVNNSGDGIVIVTRDHKIAFVNQRILALTGFSKQQMIGSSYVEYLELDNPEKSLATLAELLASGGNLRTEHYLKHANGQTMLMDIKSTMVEYQGAPAMVAFLRDVTPEHLAAEELRLQKQQLERLVAEKTDHLSAALALAETANQAKSRFLANISHELRTPLHAVLSYADFGEEKSSTAEPEKLQQYFNRIHSSGKRLLQLVNNLLDISQLETDKLILNKQPCNIRLLIDKVLDDLQLKLNGHPVSVIPGNTSEPLIATCDFDRICQVVNHLLLNALQYSADNAPVEILLSKEIDQIRVVIKDQGVGLIEDEITNLFTPFTESSLTRTGAGGTGLGLTICKKIIDVHGGSLTGENNPERGASFAFTLPDNAPESGR